MTANENLEAISVSDTVPDLAVFFFFTAALTMYCIVYIGLFVLVKDWL